MKNKYDVIIIGAGIGGLVCGCYLAKTGMKVLMVEQHSKPGGYCSSFNRNGFVFDVAVHYLGGGRERGEVGRIVKELGLHKYFNFIHIDPCDKVIIPNNIVFIRKNCKETIEEFKKGFPHENKNIDNFFNFILKNNFLDLYASIKNKTFKELLDHFFKDKSLIAILNILLGNIGLPASRLSALTGATLYREFILDGGYYPEGGVQVFADSLAKTFRDFDGELILSRKVKKILTRNKCVYGIVMENNEIITSEFIVSNADATQTFNNLLDIRNKEISKKIQSMELSPSVFAIYLGLNIDLRKVLNDHCAIWYFTTFDIDDCYGNYKNNILNENLNYIVCTFPSLHDSSLAPKGKSTMQVFVCAPFNTKEFWKNNREKLCKKMIQKAGELIPNLSEFIDIKVTGTPQTFHRYTLNREGAMYGWASIPSQIDSSILPKETKINKLYCAGHWSTSGLGQGGVTSVAYSGRSTAKLIVKQRKVVSKNRQDECIYY